MADGKTKCPHVEGCELFPRFKVAATLGVWKTLFCEGNYSRCARYKQSLEGKPVPPDLLPNGQRLIIPGGNTEK